MNVSGPGTVGFGTSSQEPWGISGTDCDLHHVLLEQVLGTVKQTTPLSNYFT